jgi:GT2 family glycosyltransferase
MTAPLAFPRLYNLELGGSWTEVPSKSPAGVLGNETPLKYRQAGPGKGCWITRTAFDAVGGLDEGIVVNKDTEFSVRLATSGHRFYCDQTPGVFLIHDPVRSAPDQSSITKAAGARARFLGFEYVLLKHQDFLKGHRTFRQKMFARAVKYRIRAGSMAGWFRFCTQHQPVSDVFIYIVAGTLWLDLSKLISRKPQ